MNMEAIGAIEFTSIASGIEAVDVMLKQAEVNLVEAHPICPGKYLAVISGDVASVRAALESGEDVGESHTVDHVIIPQVHPELLPALTRSSEVSEIQSLGVIELFSVTSCLLAADASVKAAGVRLIEVRLGMGIAGKSFLSLTGSVDEVREAIQTGIDAALDTGMVLGSTIIPAPHEQLKETLI